MHNILSSSQMPGLFCCLYLPLSVSISLSFHYMDELWRLTSVSAENIWISFCAFVFYIMYCDHLFGLNFSEFPATISFLLWFLKVLNFILVSQTECSGFCFVKKSSQMPLTESVYILVGDLLQILTWYRDSMGPSCPPLEFCLWGSLSLTGLPGWDRPWAGIDGISLKRSEGNTYVFSLTKTKENILLMYNSVFGASSVCIFTYLKVSKIAFLWHWSKKIKACRWI